jgi:molecular chaperone DnaK
MTLGRFRLEGIAPAPRGVPQIEVTFDIDANGILNVSAKDKATGKEQKIAITASTNLEKKDVERLVREAQQHASEDRKRRELVDARNQADTIVYQVEKALKGVGDQLPGADRSRIEAKIGEVRSAMEGDDPARILRGAEELQQVANALAQQTAARGSGGGDGGGRGGPSSGSGTGSDDVVEGEFTEV